ncbi:MAG: efflux RND transporter periplasmic adaptor subunit [Candidatus Moranbacteria bacterium]|nr:efflux RND transporter periplasmic adaptor subunit [Candidatus Moranbacteria bacterium]
MKKKTKIIWGIVIVVAIAGLSYWYVNRKPTALFVTEQVSRTTVEQTVSVTGELAPRVYTDLSFNGAGTVKEVLVARGDFVKAGQTIATIDTSVLRSQLANANITLSIAEQNEQLARRGRVVSWKKLAPEEREAKILATEQARHSVQTLRAQITQTTLVSPIDGIVSKLDLREGETALAGKVIGRISDDDSSDRVLEARVPEADINKLALGIGATVTFDALSKDDVFHASVYEMEFSSTVVQDVVSFVTRFWLLDGDDRLREGMSATIDTVTAKSANVLAVPFRAVVREGTKNFVDISRDGLTTERREVTLGLEGDDGMIEVKSGLSEGDPVVTSKV